MFEKLKENTLKIGSAVSCTTATMVARANAFAVKVNQNADIETVGGSIIDKLGMIAGIIGGGIAVFGVITLGLAIMNPDSPPEKKTQGIATILGGAIIAGAVILLQGVGILAK